MKENKRVLLGMSGGTDSSVSAMLLKKQGFEVVGATLQLWNAGEGSSQHIEDARALANRLGIKHHILEVTEDFNKNVISYFVDEYLSGRTPAPCTQCNAHIKWQSLLDAANAHNCYWIATGHYVRKQQIGSHFYWQRGKDPLKDQSYYLWRVGQEILSRALLPLGEFTKAEVRQMAIEMGFPALATKKESMGVCFLHGKHYTNVLNAHAPQRMEKIAEGEILDQSGQIVGKHQGFPFYTLGQKKGFTAKAEKGDCVVKIDHQQNRLILGKPQDLFYSKLIAKQSQIIDEQDFFSRTDIQTVIRGVGINPQGYCRIEKRGDHLEILLSEDAWAPCQGQPLVFYAGDRVLGGAILESYSQST